jgi:hypothetical protein
VNGFFFVKERSDTRGQRSWQFVECSKDGRSTVHIRLLGRIYRRLFIFGVLVRGLPCGIIEGAFVNCYHLDHSVIRPEKLDVIT